MLEAPRLLLARALEPLYPLEPPPNASRFPPPLRERSRPPMRSAPPPPAPSPPPARLPRPPSPARLLAREPPCRPTCCRALACRLESESPRAVPPNRSAVAWSRYGAPPRCCGLCFQLASPPRFPAPMLLRSPPLILFRFPPLMFVLRFKLLLLLMLISLFPQPAPQPQPPPTECGRMAYQMVNGRRAFQ